MVKPAKSVLSRVDHRACGAQGERLVEHLIVPQCLIVRVEEEVRMALDHPGHEGGAGEVDYLRAGGGGEVRPGGRDAVAVDEHRPAFVGTGVHPVEYACGAQQDRLRERRRRD